MANWYIRKFLKFFERRRGRLLTFLGMTLILPNIILTEQKIRRLEKTLNEEVALKGRLDLLSSVLQRNWRR